MDDIELFQLVNAKLSPGLEIKNYGKLCDMLNLPHKQGKAKILQMENLRRYFSYEKKGHKIIIKEVAQNPVIKIDRRKNGNNNIYTKLIECILLAYFLDQNKVRCCFTRKQLFEVLGLVNEDYSKYQYDYDDFLEDMKIRDLRIQVWHIENFYKRTSGKLSSIIVSALNSLRNRKLIEYDREIVACRGKLHIAVTDDLERETVLRCEREALDELGCSGINDILYSKNRNINYKTYIDIRNRKLQESLDFDYIYRRFVVICNRQYLERGLQENIENIKRELNYNVVDACNKLAEHDFDKNRERLKSGKTKMIYPNYYVDIQKLLAYRLLNIDENLLAEFEEKIAIDTELDDLFG